MGWFKKMMGRSSPDKTDYHEEGRALVAEGKFQDALSAFNLALKESPGDPDILVEIAMIYTRLEMSDEAAKTYRHVLRQNPRTPAAHYGLGFLLRRAGQTKEAADHLAAFLANPPKQTKYEDKVVEEHLTHARNTLEALQAEEQKQADDDADG